MKNDKFPVILMLDKERDNTVINEWLLKSSIRTFEAADALDVCVEISDFTSKECLDLIILRTFSTSTDLELIKSMSECERITAARPPVILFSEKKGLLKQGNYLESDSAAIDARLDHIFPAKILRQIRA
jgi:hypothetical protein